jgi:predicted O-linked N-acetylglucosamine transferase (SPINDLY family)
LTAGEALQRAFAALQREDWREVRSLCDAVLRAQPGNPHALYYLGFVALRTGRMADAAELLGAVASRHPDNAEVHNNLGMALGALGRHVEALASYERAVALRPDYANAWVNKGNLLHELKRCGDALECLDRARALHVDADTCYNRGNVLRDLGRHAEAIESYTEALALDARHIAAHINRGTARAEAGDAAGALSDCESAIALAPGHVEAHNNRGNALCRLRRYDEAIASYRQGLSIEPDHADLHNNLGNALRDAGRLADALASYSRAIALRKHAGYLVNRGNLLRDSRHFAEAKRDYAAAMALEPDRDFLMGTWLHARMKICDWLDLPANLAWLAERIAAGRRAAMPFSAMTMTAEPALQERAARTWVAATLAAEARRATPIAKREQGSRIRLGYFSADLHDGAMTQLVAELFELHDRSRFHVTGFSLGPPSDDAMRRRVVAAFDRFVDVGDRSLDEIVQTARDLEIDIAIDLNGFTMNNRAGVFARRVAPIQVAYLGFAATMGAEFIDYLIADQTLIPEQDRQWYAEKIVCMPHSYMVNDRRKKIADAPATRAGCGLPDTAFGYCCFNSSYKITPDVFDVWMRVLSRVNDSLLWLLEDNAAATRNLRTAASLRGIAPERLVFAPRLPLPEHLARHRLADLFLDTLPVNAHTTASDALWAGVPVLTCPGRTLASRVAASLLGALRMPDLIADSMAAYEALAVELATSAARLRELRERLSANRLTTPLFDSARSTRHFEAAYVAMMERHRADLPPDHIHVLP